VLSINKTVGFEISEIPCAQWNSIFGSTDPGQGTAHLVNVLDPGYKRAVLGTTILSNGITDISVQPTEMTRLVKVDHFQR